MTHLARPEASVAPETLARARELQRVLRALDPVSQRPELEAAVAELARLLRECADASGAERELVAQLRSLELAELSDFALVELGPKLKLGELRQQSCRGFLHAVVLPKLLALRGPASRQLMATVVAASGAAPRPTAEAILVPLLLQPPEVLHASHCEVAGVLLREGLPPVPTERAREARVGGGGGAGGPFRRR